MVLMDGDGMNQLGFERQDEACEWLAARLVRLHAGELPALNEAMKDRIRTHMFERIEQFAAPGDEEDSESYLIDRLISWMKGHAEKISLSAVKKAFIREKLQELPVFVPVLRFGFFRKFAASLSLGGVFAMSIFAFMLRVPVTFAQEYTVVHEASGDAMIVRDGDLLPAVSGFELREGDLLQIGSNGQAVVRYFDRSFTRFFPNTDVSFDALKSENFGVDHRVELDLRHGTVWSNILDLVTNSEFTVKSGSLVASASKRATFSLSSGTDESQLQVFQNVVNVGSHIVLNGYKAVFPSSGDVVVKPLALQDEEKVWVSQNLASDEKLVREARKDLKGVVAGPSNVLQENASLLLAFSSTEKYRLELGLCEKSFYDALQKNGATIDEVRAAFRCLEEVAARSGDFQDEDLKKMSDAVLLSARGRLFAMPSESGLYALKIELEDRVLASSDDSNKPLIALDQALQFLIEAQLFREKGLKDETDRAISGFRDRLKIVDSGSEALRSADVSAKRRELETMYLAFSKPVVIASKETVKDNVGDSVAAGSGPALDTKNSQTAETAPSTEASADTFVVENGARADSEGDSGELKEGTGATNVTDASALPPKLQLSQE
jgi:hypothetical protein